MRRRRRKKKETFLKPFKRLSILRRGIMSRCRARCALHARPNLTCWTHVRHAERCSDEWRVNGGAAAAAARLHFRSPCYCDLTCCLCVILSHNISMTKKKKKAHELYGARRKTRSWSSKHDHITPVCFWVASPSDQKVLLSFSIEEITL